MKFVIYHSSNVTDPRQSSNQELVSFRKGMEREVIVYPTLKDVTDFDGFSRRLYITAKSHECEEVIDAEYSPSNAQMSNLQQNKFSYSLYLINIC